MPLRGVSAWMCVGDGAMGATPHPASKTVSSAGQITDREVFMMPRELGTFRPQYIIAKSICFNDMRTILNVYFECALDSYRDVSQ